MVKRQRVAVGEGQRAGEGVIGARNGRSLVIVAVGAIGSTGAKC